MAAVACGLALLFVQNDHSAATAPDPMRGNVYAAASGLTYALTLAGLRWLGRGSKSDAGIATVAMGNLMVAVALSPMALPIRAVSGADVAVMLYMGIFQVGLAYVLVTRALRHVPAFEANTVLLLEPALNPVWVWMLHGERPGAWALVVSGKNDILFSGENQLRYREVLPNAEIQLTDSGHCALADKSEEIASRMHNFLGRVR